MSKLLTDPFPLYFCSCPDKLFTHKTEQVSLKRRHIVKHPTRKLNDRDTWELPLARYRTVMVSLSAGEISGLKALRYLCRRKKGPTITHQESPLTCASIESVIRSHSNASPGGGCGTLLVGFCAETRLHPKSAWPSFTTTMATPQ